MGADDRKREGGKRARTRAALIASALEVIAEKGFAAASLDEIAARAGMTKGAIYSNFSGKAELLMRAMEARGLTLAGPRGPASDLGEELEETALALSALVRRARSQERFLAEFQLYALSDPDFLEVLGKSYLEAFPGVARYLATLPGGPPPERARRLAVALQAIALGFLLQSLLTPGEVTDGVIGETFEALARGLASPEDEPAPSRQ